MVPCSASILGCDFETKRFLIAEHGSSCPFIALGPLLQKQHDLIKLQDDRIQKQNDRLEEHAMALKKLKLKNSVLEASLSTTQRRLENNDCFTSETEEIPELADLENLLPHRDGSRSGPRTPNNRPSQTPPETPTRHLLSLYEGLREEFDQIIRALNEVDGRASMSIMNEALRTKEEMSYMSAAINALRMQVQWLTNNTRAQAQRSNVFVPARPGASASANGTSAANAGDNGVALPPPVEGPSASSAGRAREAPPRRLSEERTKL